MRVRFIVLVAFLFPAVASAQFCDTVTDEAFQAYFDNLLSTQPPALRAWADTAVIDIPVTFHVQRGSGGPVIDDASIISALLTTNRWYAAGGIRFVKCGETRLYDPEEGSESNRRTVNVTVYSAASGCGVAMGSFVSINIRCNRSFVNILSHELGHVVGLPHTHGRTNSGTTTELVDGSNCDLAGDRFCDTPADPNLLGKVNGSCAYTGTVRDANGMQYRPLTDNIMSYTTSRCADSLTPMQLAYARSVALASSYVCCGIEEPIAQDTAVCVGASAVLRASTPSGTLEWYDLPEGGSPVGTGPLFSTGPLTATRSWYVEAVDSCRSPRARVVVRVHPEAGVLTDIPRLLRDIDSAGSSRPSGLLATDTLLFFRASGGDLWCTNGTGEGTRMRMQFQGGDGERSIISMTAWRDLLLFGVNDRGAGPALWRMPLAEGPPETVMQFDAREEFSNFWITDAGDHVLFILNDGNDRTELWRSDGTTAGTRRIAMLPECSAFEDFGFTALQDRVFFQAFDSLHGGELWSTDGSAAGTRLLADLWPGSVSSDPGGFTVVDGLLYFSAADSLHGRELWVTDGTTEGTQLVADIQPGPGDSSPYPITPIDGSLYFSADDGTAGMEPFRSDGTPGGTQRIADIRDGNGSFPSHYFSLNGALLCSANDGGGNEFWLLDPAGLRPARLLRDINPLGASYPMNPLQIGELLYFSAHDGFHGRELWRSDGTESGTYMVADIAAGQSSSSPGALTAFRGQLFFTASDSVYGQELRLLAPQDVSVCNGARAELRAGNGEGTVRWYDSADATAPLAEGNVYRTSALHQSRTYWADVTVAGCRSLRTAIPVQVRAPDPFVRDTSAPAYGSVVLQASAASGEINWFLSPSAPQPFHLGNTLSVLLGGNDTVLYVRSVEGGCSSALIPLRVRVSTSSVTGILPERLTLQSWPQPVHDLLHLRTGRAAGTGTVIVRDLLGRELLRSTHELAPDNALRLDVRGLTPGTYLLLLKHVGGTAQLLFVRQ
jgi:ELWxxDGT repeat protein